GTAASAATSSPPAARPGPPAPAEPNARSCSFGRPGPRWHPAACSIRPGPAPGEGQNLYSPRAAGAAILGIVGRGYGQYCPIAKGAEILAERWTPLVVRNINAGAHSFSDIHRGCPQMSRTILVQRLRALERAQVIERTAAPGGRGFRYHLT